jgi:hypothetical protein
MFGIFLSNTGRRRYAVRINTPDLNYFFLCREKRYISKGFSFNKKEGYGIRNPGIIDIFLLMPVQKVAQIRVGEKLVYLGLDQIYS